MMAWHQKQNMMEHLVAIQRITAALAGEDWDEIAAAAALVETSPQMQQMCEHMGAGAEGFTELALEFHRRADAIGEAARAHDGPEVLRATSTTLEACTSCHASYRQEVVDAATWQARTGSTHAPPAAGHHGAPP
jgi:cytochrome c556